MNKIELILTKAQVPDFAKKVAKDLQSNPVLGLSGDLGAGKTFFCQELIKLLTGEKTLNITSPTFNIVNLYKTKDGKSIYHFDLYRIKTEAELENIGFFEALDEGICLIEWPEVAKNFLQNINFLSILKVINNKRKFIYVGGSNETNDG